MNLEKVKHYLVYFLLFIVVASPCFASHIRHNHETAMAITFRGEIYKLDGYHDVYEFTIEVQTHYDLIGRLEWIKITKGENYDKRFDSRRYKFFGTFTGPSAQRYLTDFCQAVNPLLESEFVSICDIKARLMTGQHVSYKWWMERNEYWIETKFGLIRTELGCS
jgi:hypothetical protein